MSASPDRDTSTPVTDSTPSSATAVPAQARFGSRSPSSRPKIAAHTAWEQMSAAAEATEV